jgi:uncharacterized membrane protein
VSRATIAVWALMGTYAAVYVSFGLVKWAYYLYDDFDLAIYSQAAWNVMRGTLHSSVLGLNLLGNHMSLLIIPIAPIYAIFRSPVTLLVLQTVVLALGALPVWWLARREIRNDFIAVCFAALYLLYPALGYTNLYEFHPETLATTGLLYAFYFLWVGKFWWMTLFTVLALLTKEDVPVVVGMMGLYALAVKVPRRWIYSAMLTGLAVAFLILAFVIVMPTVNKGEVQLEKIYSQWGDTTGEALKAMARDPVRAATTMVVTPGSPQDSRLKQEYYAQMLLPVMLLAVMSPLTLAIALPAVAQHLLSGRITDHTIVYHYTAYVTPFVLAASVLGLRNVLRLMMRDVPGGLTEKAMNTKTPPRTLGMILAGTAVAVAVGCQLLFGPVLGSGILQTYPPAEQHWPSPYRRAQAPFMSRMAARIPKEGTVVTTFGFMSHVANRPVLYSLHHIYKGKHTMSDKDYPVPDNVVALAADVNEWLYLSFSRVDGGERLRELLRKNRLSPVDSAGDAVLFLRDAEKPIELYETGRFTPDRRQRHDFNKQLSFLGWDPLPATAEIGGRLPVRTYWRRFGDMDPLDPTAFRYYLTEFVLTDDYGRNAFGFRHYRRLGYTFYPVHDWPRDATVRELYNLMVPTDARPGAYELGVRVIEQAGRQLGPAEPADEELRRTDALIPLGKVTVMPPRK